MDSIKLHKIHYFEYCWNIYLLFLGLCHWCLLLALVSCFWVVEYCALNIWFLAWFQILLHFSTILCRPKSINGHSKAALIHRQCQWAVHRWGWERHSGVRRSYHRFFLFFSSFSSSCSFFSPYWWIGTTIRDAIIISPLFAVRRGDCPVLPLALLSPLQRSWSTVKQSKVKNNWPI